MLKISKVEANFRLTRDECIGQMEMKFSSKNKQEVWSDSLMFRLKVSLLLEDISIQNNTDFKQAHTLV